MDVWIRFGFEDCLAVSHSPRSGWIYDHKLCFEDCYFSILNPSPFLPSNPRPTLIEVILRDDILTSIRAEWSSPEMKRESIRRTAVKGWKGKGWRGERKHQKWWKLLQKCCLFTYPVKGAFTPLVTGGFTPLSLVVRKWQSICTQVKLLMCDPDLSSLRLVCPCHSPLLRAPPFSVEVGQHQHQCLEWQCDTWFTTGLFSRLPRGSFAAASFPLAASGFPPLPSLPSALPCLFLESESPSKCPWFQICPVQPRQLKEDIDAEFSLVGQ